MTTTSDLRRHVSFRAHGAVRMVNWVQAGLGDIEGAVAARQLGVVAAQARTVVLQCLSVRSLARSGEVEWDGAAFDFFAGLTAEEIESGLSLAVEAVDLEGDRADDWLERVRRYAAETERLLGYDEPLAILRSRRGPFGIVKLAREWSSILAELDLPPHLPPKWVRSSP
jgi:hypothetical protein